MNKIIKILLLIMVISLVGCSDGSSPIEERYERYPVQPNEDNFSGCYYFAKDGDYYNLIIEVYINEFNTSINIKNSEELHSKYFDLTFDPDVEEEINFENDSISLKCEESSITASYWRRTTSITDKTIDEANDAIRDFEFQISLKDDETYESITYIGYLDFIEE
jgi:hypothetical protein